MKSRRCATQRRRLEDLQKAALRQEDLAAKNLADYQAKVAKLEESLLLHQEKLSLVQVRNVIASV